MNAPAKLLRCSDCLTEVEYLAPPAFVRCHDCQPAPSDEFDFVSNWPTRCHSESLAAAQSWNPWPFGLESPERLPITEPNDDTDTRRNPTPSDPDDDEDSDEDGPGNEVELSAEDYFDPDQCRRCGEDCTMCECGR